MTVDKGIFIRNIYYMLSYAFQILKQEDYKKVAGEKFERIHDLFAAILEKGVSRQVKQGLYREYVPMHNDLSVMRGKLDIGETARLQMQRKRQLSCEYDEFSEDNIYNQILKVTLHRLIRAEDVADERKQALKRLYVFFGNVSLIQPDRIAWSRLIYRRNNRNYELLLNICRFVLSGMLQTTKDGSYKLISFSDEHMNRLYEKFILEYYAKECPQIKATASQIPWALDDGVGTLLPIMQSDIMLTKGNTVLIIDAKYYTHTTQAQYDVHTLHSGNLYQIFTYVKNKDKEFGEQPHTVSGMLLYAATDEAVQPDNVYHMSGNKISVKTLDLNREFSEIAAQLNAIVDEHFQ